MSGIRERPVLNGPLFSGRATHSTLAARTPRSAPDTASECAREAVRMSMSPLTAEHVDLLRTTAVVSTWNKREDLRENLVSLLAQTLPFESIVVVDNASTDGTVEM